MRPILHVQDLGKQYRIGERMPTYGSLRESLMRAMSAPWRWVRGGKKSPDSLIWALRDVNFEVKPGEVVGVIGRNGAGKSTLLKILSRITEPTTGSVDLYGRVGSLLEIGTGFHPELTGRENIFLNGAILGMKRREILRKFDAIVAFAELDQFLDTQVKHYSSGMYMRLAFAVAAHLEPEILLVDEVLAVGDAAFQKKCLGKMGEIAHEGRTVLFVSHNMAAIEKLCSRCLSIEKGRLSQDGPASTVVRDYLLGASQAPGQFGVGSRQIPARGVEIQDAWLEKAGIRTSSVLFDDTLDVFLSVRVHQPVRFSVELLLRQQDGLPVAFAPSGLAWDWEIDGVPGTMTVRCRLPRMRYAIGTYYLDLMLADTGRGFFDCLEGALCFAVEHAAIGNRNWGFSQSRGQGCHLWDVKFEMAEASESTPCTLPIT